MDCGCSAFALIHPTTVNRLNLPTKNLAQPILVTLADGTPANRITMQTTDLTLSFGTHQESIKFYVSSIPQPILLGLPWLRYHNPAIDWDNGTITFRDNCVKQRHCTAPVKFSAIPKTRSSSSENTSSPTQKNLKINVSIMDHRRFLNLARKKKLDIYQCSYQWDFSQGRVISVNSIQTAKTYTASSTPLDDRGIPQKYAEFQDVFHNKTEPALPLPKHREYDLSIELDESKGLPNPGKVYPLSPEQDKALLEFLDKGLARQWINKSNSPVAAPCFFVKKPNGDLRLCIDYRALNRITKKNRYPIPLIPEVLDELIQARIFTRLDMPDAYHLVRVKAGDEWKTSFRCKFGQFEYNVIPFGLSNAPAAFQAFMNDVFKDLLHKFVVVYFDDILVYSKDPQEHDANVKQVLSRLREHGLSVNPQKCSFDVTAIDFLGYIVSNGRLSMDPAKIEIIKNWRTPNSVKDVQSFLGFANFYRRFIENFAQVTKPLTSLFKKNVKFRWTTWANEAFQTLLKSFTSPTILHVYNFSKPAIIETDASDFAIAAILSQPDDLGNLHPVAFHSRTLRDAEINYDTHDKELLAIIDAIEAWKHYLITAPPDQPFTVFSDHKNLQSFATTLKLSRRQYRWMETLSDFNFKIIHRPGRLNGKADILSRLSQLQDEVSNRPNPNERTLFTRTPENELIINRITSDAILVTPESEFINQLRTATAQSTLFSDFNARKSPLALTLEDGILYLNNLLVLPNAELQLQAMIDSHSTAPAGHFGVNKTLELLQRNFFWPGMRRSVQKFIKGCEICSRAKADRSKPFGLLHPLPIPQNRWTDLSIDFITDLPPSGTAKFDSICVVKCRLTKQAHFLPTHKSIDAPQTAELFLQNIFRLHGFPNTITSDRGPQFVSLFWERFLFLLNCERHLTSAYHPQSNSSAEVTNQIIEQYLRIHCNYEQTDWTNFLPIAEFAYNNSLNSTTQMTPFFANQGYHPQFSTKVTSTSTIPAAEERIKQIDSTLTELRSTLKFSQETYSKFANQRRQPHCFKIGDNVFLNRKNIKTTRPSLKLDDKFFGPFKIIEKINDVSFKLKLPKTLKIHPVFHVSLFKRKDPDNISLPSTPPPDPISIDNNLEYEVEAILDSKRYRNSVRYLVHWKGYDKLDRTWEPLESLNNCPDLLQDFHDRNPHKPQTKGISGRNSKGGDTITVCASILSKTVILNRPPIVLPTATQPQHTSAATPSKRYISANSTAILATLIPPESSNAKLSNELLPVQIRQLPANLA